jgi:hypothetical protein
MGGKDFRKREKKKQKKGPSKAVSTTVPQSPMTVEVVKKKRGAKESEEE